MSTSVLPAKAFFVFEVSYGLFFLTEGLYDAHARETVVKG